MLTLFLKGGPLMWPLLLLSVATFSVALERLWFLSTVGRRKPNAPRRTQDVHGPSRFPQAPDDYVARALRAGLERPAQFSEAFQGAARKELAAFARGLAWLEAAVTLAPLLGLLGTVTGLIRAFGLLGDAELQAPAALTGGIAEALIATAFGLGIAIVALVPFAATNAALEAARMALEEAGTEAELRLLETPR